MSFPIGPCHLCKFWDGTYYWGNWGPPEDDPHMLKPESSPESHYHARQEEGMCKKNAPTTEDTGHGMGQGYPITARLHGCGEWKERTQ